MPEDIPKTVERYVDEHQEEQGMDEDKAWAVAWSRYCSDNPDSPHCQQDEYFPNRPEVAEGIRESNQQTRGPVMKDQLIRIGSDRPDLRDHIEPIVDRLDKHAYGNDLLPPNVMEEVEKTLENHGFKKIKEGNVSGGLEAFFEGRGRKLRVEAIRTRYAVINIETQDGKEFSEEVQNFYNIEDKVADIVRQL